MPKQSENGNWVFAAGELANYEVCPHAWYLEHIKKVPLEHSRVKEHGRKKHQVWVTQTNRTYFFTRSFRVIIYSLIILMVLVLPNLSR